VKALSVRQPWAWLIIHGGKDIENRAWHTNVRGRVLIHAAKGMTLDEYHGAINFIVAPGMPPLPFDLPAFKHLERGGIIGSVEIMGCVRHSESPWFAGKFGFVLRNPKECLFAPWRGQLGFFDVPNTLVKEAE
jgi:hypothetical protein